MKKTIFILVAIVLSMSCKQIQNESNLKENETIILDSIQPKKIETAVLAGGELFRIDSFPSKYIVPRPVDIWLPKNYSKDKKYSVLYMHDGQNLFDGNTTWNKQEWMVDENATKLIDANIVNEFIVIAIHNIPSIRWQDLFPEKAFNYMPEDTLKAMLNKAKKNNFNIDLKGDEYLKFIVEEVKPYIDQTYATKIDKANTFVSGSSMGGLMSMYAICEYPEIFGGAACISTHWPGIQPEENSPTAKAIFDYMKANIPSAKDHKLYFDFGTKTLDQYYPQYEDTVNKIFVDAGYSDSNFKNLKFEGTDHSEKSWQKRFDIPLKFLLKK